MVNGPVKFYLNNHETWDAMLELISNARKSVDLEQFIFSDDSIGQKFIDLLIQKAQDGIKIRLLCDTVGSWNFYSSGRSIQMRESNISVRFVNPVSPWRINNFFSWFLRDHRKVLIVDDKISIIGSTGIREDMADWRDTNILVKNEAVNEICSAFNEMWERTAEKNKISRMRRIQKLTSGFQFVTNAPYFRKRFVYYKLVEKIRTSTSHVYLATPYFIPDHKFSRVLSAAAKRGIDVRIMTPTTKQEKEPFVGHAMRSHYESMLRAGVRIFEYNKAFMHAKTAVIDDNWSTVGSFNLDSLSFLYNYEANIVSTDEKVVRELNNHFLKDLKSSNEVTWENWSKRPIIQKIQEVLVIPIRRLL